MRSSSGVIRLGGLAALVGGAMWVVKGGVFMLGGPDLFIPAQFFFALGLLGLHARLAGRGGLPGRVGGFLAYAAVALSAVNATYTACSSHRTGRRRPPRSTQPTLRDPWPFSWG